MPGKSQSHTDAVLNVLRGSAVAGVTPNVGLFSVPPADDNSAGTELAGDGYTRQAITFGAPATDAGNVRKVANTNLIQFGPALVDWSQAVAFGVFASLAGRAPVLGHPADSQDCAAGRLWPVCCRHAGGEGGLRWATTSPSRIRPTP